jgi:hypothetical protein
MPDVADAARIEIEATIGQPLQHLIDIREHADALPGDVEVFAELRRGDAGLRLLRQAA